MATAAKTHVVVDAEQRSSPKSARTSFPGAAAGLLDALGAARYRSAAGTPKLVVIVEGRQRKVIRSFESDHEVWSTSRAEIRHERGDAPQG